MSDLNNNFYKVLFSQAKELLCDESNFIAKCANLSALLYSSLSDVNWVGFYLVDDNNSDELCLGPFQGGVACYRIKVGEGVCGNAFKNKKSICVDDVNKFVGHIACDANTKSELVIPVFLNKKIKAVLDLDSASLSRFGHCDVFWLEKIAGLFC